MAIVLTPGEPQSGSTVQKVESVSASSMESVHSSAGSFHSRAASVYAFWVGFHKSGMP